MPNPNSGESRDDFMGRCIPMLIDEGKPQDQAVAICADIFERNKEKEKEKSEASAEAAKEKASQPIYDAIRGTKKEAS